MFLSKSLNRLGRNNVKFLNVVNTSSRQRNLIYLSGKQLKWDNYKQKGEEMPRIEIEYQKSLISFYIWIRYV